MGKRSFQKTQGQRWYPGMGMVGHPLPGQVEKPGHLSPAISSMLDPSSLFLLLRTGVALFYSLSRWRSGYETLPQLMNMELGGDHKEEEVTA